ncbi:MAG: nitroreductase family protein [Clostridia bacterium]|nr:nitroreductase family protein [Clostridia bacterium]
MFLKLIEKARTIRRFDRSKLVTDKDLMHILECARLTPSAANLQRLRYITVSGDEAQSAFQNISMGGYLPESQKPDESVMPTSYLVIVTENENPDSNLMIDTGITAEAIVLAAAERGIGACIIRNFKKEYFSSLVKGDKYFPVLVIALGYPAEDAKIVPINESVGIKYYKNNDGVNCVPKRSLSELIVGKIG